MPPLETIERLSSVREKPQIRHQAGCGCRMRWRISSRACVSRKLEGAGQDLRRKIHRDHLQAAVGCLEAWHRATPQRRCLIVTRALFAGGGEKGLFYRHPDGVGAPYPGNQQARARPLEKGPQPLVIATQTTHGYSIFRTSSSRRHVVSKAMPARSTDSLKSLASSANASSIDGKSV